MVKMQFEKILQSEIFCRNGAEIDFCESIVELCDAIVDESETDWSIGEGEICDLSALLIGSYWALSEWHSGQTSDEYRALCAIGRIYSPNASGVEPESSEEIAYDLLNKFFERI